MRAFSVIILFVILLGLDSCKVYSFSGANIDPALNSISISYFNNDSGQGPASVSDQFTQSLKDKMLNNTNLDLVNRNGDVQLSGSIVGYNYSIQAPTGTETSDLRRITVTVKVNFENLINAEDNWEQNFTRYAEYPVSEGLESVEESLIDEISALIVDDVFNKAFVKW